MGNKTVSPGKAIAAIIIILGVLGGGIWWKFHGSMGSTDAYSAGVAKLEQSDELQKAVETEEWRNKNPDAAKAYDSLNADKAYQPESGTN